MRRRTAARLDAKAPSTARLRAEVARGHRRRVDRTREPIAAPRNAASLSAAGDLLSIVRDLAQTNAEVSKVLASKVAGMMDAVVECVRVVVGTPSRRVLADATLGLKRAPEADDDDREPPAPRAESER